MYTVKILSSEDFDKLPFKRAKEALGAADAKTGIAYVRDTGYNDVTKHTIEHELDELMQKVSPHEEDGIRYKIPVLGPIFSGLGNVAGAVGSGIGKVAGGIGNVAKSVGGAAFSGAKAIGSGIKSGAQHLGNFLTPGPEIFGPNAGAGGTSIPTPPGAQTATFPGIGQGPIPRPSVGSSPKPSFLDSVFSAGKSALGQFGIGGGGQQQQQPGNILPGGPPGTGTGTPPANPTFMDNLFKQLPGLAIGGLGELLAPKVEVPDISGITDGIRGRITGDALSPLFDVGSGEIHRILESPIDAPPEEAFARGDSLILEQTAEDIKALRDQFKQLNPTADVENNSAFLAEKSKIEERSRERRAQVRDEISFQFEREQLQRRLEATQLALNLDISQTSQLIQLAQMDLEAIGAQLSLDAADARDFKALFSDFGQLINQPQPQQPQTA